MFETAETSRPHYTFAYWWSSATTALVTVAHKSNKMKRSISIPRPRKQPRRVINTTVDDTDSVSCSSLSSSCDDGNDHAEEPHPPPPRQQQMRQRLSASSLRQNEHTHHLSNSQRRHRRPLQHVRPESSTDTHHDCPRTYHIYHPSNLPLT